MNRRQIRINRLSVALVPSSTRPSPIDGPSAETPRHRIAMDVIDRSQHNRNRMQIPIVARPFLPEPKHLAATFGRRQPPQQGALGLDQQLLDPIRTGSFDGVQQGRDIASARSRVDQQMHVLGHEHERNKGMVVVVKSPIDRLGEKPSPRVVGEQAKSISARKRELVQIARLVIMLDRSTMPLGSVHATNGTRSRSSVQVYMYEISGIGGGVDIWEPGAIFCQG